jgi:hypothetical protein
MQSSVKRNPFALLLGAALLAAPLPLYADEPAAPPAEAVEAAKGHYKRARELYDENNFRGALVEMQRAFDLSKNPKLLFDLGQVHYQLQEYPAALDAFSRYLAVNKGTLSPQRVEEVQKDIDKLKTRIGTVRITSNRPGAQILVDDAPAGVAPLADPVLVGAGRHKITATAEGQTALPKVVDVAGGETLEVSLVFAESAPHPGADQEPPRSSAPVFAAWAITGGLAVATAVTGGLALSKSGKLKTDLDTPGVTRAQLDVDRSAGKTTALVSDVLLGTTIAGAVTSVVLTVVRRPVKRAPEGAVSVRIGPGYFGLAGKF